MDQINAGRRKCLDRPGKYLSKPESMANIPELHQRLVTINGVIRECSTTNDNAFDASVMVLQ